MREREGRLIFIHPSDELYGADRILLELLAAVPDGLRVEVWLPCDLEHPSAPLCERLEKNEWTVRHLDLPIVRRSYLTLSGIISLARRSVALWRELRRSRPSTVYCTTSAAFIGAPIARLAGVPRVLGHIQELWAGTDKVLLSGPAIFCHSLIAISQAVRCSLPRPLRSRTGILLNATPEPDRITPLAMHTGQLTYTVASRWSSRKGHATLLAAWDRAGCPGHLLVLGGPPLSGESVDVPTMVSRLANPSSVRLVGEVSDSAPFIDEADIVIVPSDEPEGFGLVAVEAFAHGRPVVASAAGGLLEVVSPKSNGWLFPPGDVGSLAQILDSLDREIVEAAGRSARQSYEQRFTTDRLRRDWRALLGHALHD